MKIWRSLHYWEAIRIGTNTNAAWWRSQDASFLLFQWSRWRPLDFLVKRANASFNMIIALLLDFFFVGFLCNRLGHVVKLARRCSFSQYPPFLTPGFYLCLKFTPRVRNSTRNILPRLPQTSATRVEKVCADIIRSHSLCCRAAGHRAVVVVAAVCAVYTWTLIWIWSLSQQTESWFL